MMWLSYGGKKLKKAPYHMFAEILAEGEVPQNWRKYLVEVIDKGGGKGKKKQILQTTDQLA